MADATEWDARSYHRVSEPQFAWGQRVLARLPLRGDETVLDAGCGSGRLTALLAERVPRGQVIALDRSRNMLEEAKATLAALGDRVSFVCADLLELSLPSPVDLVFSTATFHWVLDHDRLFSRLFAALKPGGRLHAQCGGGDNLARLHGRAFDLFSQPPFSAYFPGWKEPWLFSSAEAARERLERAGFTEVQASLEPAPATFEHRAAYSEFLRTVVLRPHLALLPTDALKDQFVSAVADAAEADQPPFTLDYVRLNLGARRP